MTDQKTCPACNGNDADAPCAYPSEGKAGCLRDERLSAIPDEPEYFYADRHSAFGKYRSPVVHKHEYTKLRAYATAERTKREAAEREVAAFTCIGVIDANGDIYPEPPPAGTQIFIKETP